MGSEQKNQLDMSDDELKVVFEAAKRAEEKAAAREARAIAVHFDESTGEVCINLSRGSRLIVPHHLIEGLAGASAERLSDVQTMGVGTALTWPQLDVDVSVQGLAMEIFGSREWMRELAKKGGSATSPAKAAAARANGRKGGRPKKAPSV